MSEAVKVKVCGICGCEKVGVAGEAYAPKLDEALGTPALRAAEIINRAESFENLGQQGPGSGDDFLQKLKKQATIVYR